MKQKEINLEERLWQLSLSIYKDMHAERPEVDIKTLAEAACIEAQSFLNTYIRKYKDFNKDIDAFKDVFKFAQV